MNLLCTFERKHETLAYRVFGYADNRNCGGDITPMFPAHRWKMQHGRYKIRSGSLFEFKWLNLYDLGVNFYVFEDHGI